MAGTWTTKDIPDLHGKTVIITGANSGIGYETARTLAGKGARTILAVRSLDKGQAAAQAIRSKSPQADVQVMLLDLADLSSIHRFAEQFLEQDQALPILINNAGVMAIPFQRTADGFEMQFGTNYLGHFALTGLLLPAIFKALQARVVTVSSLVHMAGFIRFDNLDGSQSYGPFTAYNQSKLALLLFAYQLQRRFEQAKASAISVACHPGYANTKLQATGPRQVGSRLQEGFWKLLNNTFAQNAAMGALPTLYAATAPGVNGCDYIGPLGIMGIHGYPGKVHSSKRSYNEELAQRLWKVSEELTGVGYGELGKRIEIRE